MSRVALIDADELSYKCALHYQRKWYVVKRDDKILWKEHYKEDAVASIGNQDDLEIEDYIEELDPKGYDERLSNEISRILFNTNATDYKLCLSGDNNFRYNLATLQPYKGNRTEEKPIHLKLLQEEIRWRGGESIDFLEADDLLSHYGSTIPGAVICSSDKDLRTVPSLNYNISKGILSSISPEEALYNFHYQLLIGDGTDNIPSPFGLGETKAKAFLDLADLTGSLDSLIRFYSTFLNAKNKNGTYKTKWYDGRDVREVLWEVGNLLWMHRTLSPEERWELNGT